MGLLTCSSLFACFFFCIGKIDARFSLVEGDEQFFESVEFVVQTAELEEPQTTRIDSLNSALFTNENTFVSSRLQINTKHPLQGMTYVVHQYNPSAKSWSPLDTYAILS